ncbi:glutathione-dependent formaldehyde dehydrogenase [Isoptericola sp. 4D.3]|uniref:Glutathione-dependent formaldehyde dehydrogenase n=1 Tax=Isoptericola peretonis TaxID=2918523 RepID=A0ABT0J4E3_9MICO|nr:glutathione-dependent formaldehyde dehydrogenase [Isoptericola sp. 4D.3]
MRALQWIGVNHLEVGTVPDPVIEHPQDAIVRVHRTVTCGSDLHLLAGYIPFMRSGDVIGHEFVGEIVELGGEVRRHAVGDRVVVSSFVACGRCWYCAHELYSLCDNANRNPAITENLWGAAPGGCLGYSHAMGGYAGSHAQYVRVPFADVGAFRVPDEVDDARALFASDSAATGWMGAQLGEVGPGTTVAVWGAGAVGQMAAAAADLRGAEHVVVIDRIDDRLDMVRTHVRCETLNDRRDDVGAALLELTAGRGPDVCIEAVGMEASGGPVENVVDRVKHQLRLQTDRPAAVRRAIYHCRKGGTVVVLGVFAALTDAFPLGALMNKGLTLRGAQMHGPRYIPHLLDLMARGDLVTEHLGTHVMPLEEGPEGYAMFKHKRDGCVRAVFLPES